MSTMVSRMLWAITSATGGVNGISESCGTAARAKALWQGEYAKGTSYKYLATHE